MRTIKTLLLVRIPRALDRFVNAAPAVVVIPVLVAVSVAYAGASLAASKASRLFR